MTGKLSPGAHVIKSGYPGVVIREYLPDMYEVRLSSGDVVVPRCELRATDDPDGFDCYSDHADDIAHAGACILCGSTDTETVGHVLPGTRRLKGVDPVRAARIVVHTQSQVFVDGVLLDFFTAQHITQIHDALSAANQAKMRRMTLPVAASVCFKLASR